MTISTSGSRGSADDLVDHLLDPIGVGVAFDQLEHLLFLVGLAEHPLAGAEQQRVEQVPDAAQQRVAVLRTQIAEIEMQLMAAEMSTLRIVAAASEGGVPGAESSILKVQGTEIRQAITNLLRKAIGPYALPFLPEEMEYGYEGEVLLEDYSPSLASIYFNMRKLSIFGGSNEIQKNIVSKMILEL